MVIQQPVATKPPISLTSQNRGRGERFEEEEEEEERGCGSSNRVVVLWSFSKVVNDQGYALQL